MAVIWKYIFIPVSILFLFSGCAQKKPYNYPNYEIIKPEKTCNPNRKNIQDLLDSYLGKPYVWAEEGPHAFDCSGLVYNIYGSMGMDVPRVAREQAKMGKKIARFEAELAYTMVGLLTWSSDSRVGLRPLNRVMET